MPSLTGARDPCMCVLLPWSSLGDGFVPAFLFVPQLIGKLLHQSSFGANQSSLSSSSSLDGCLFPPVVYTGYVRRTQGVKGRKLENMADYNRMKSGRAGTFAIIAYFNRV